MCSDGLCAVSALPIWAQMEESSAIASSTRSAGCCATTVSVARCTAPGATSPQRSPLRSSIRSPACRSIASPDGAAPPIRPISNSTPDGVSPARSRRSACWRITTDRAPGNGLFDDPEAVDDGRFILGVTVCGLLMALSALARVVTGSPHETKRSKGTSSWCFILDFASLPPLEWTASLATICGARTRQCPLLGCLT